MLCKQNNKFSCNKILIICYFQSIQKFLFFLAENLYKSNSLKVLSIHV